MNNEYKVIETKIESLEASKPTIRIAGATIVTLRNKLNELKRKETNMRALAKIDELHTRVDELSTRGQKAGVSQSALKDSSSATTVFDGIDVIVQEMQPSDMRILQTNFARIFDKNHSSLQTTIVGKQVLINTEAEKNVYYAFNKSTPEDIVDIVKQSAFFKTLGGANDLMAKQRNFALMLIILASKLLRHKRKDDAMLVYTYAFIKPYAGLVPKYFPHTVNEQKMTAVVESLPRNFDIVKYGSVLEVIVKKAETSFANYENVLSRGDLTDKELNDIFTSGIYGRMNSFVKEVSHKYYNLSDLDFTKFVTSTAISKDEETAGNSFEKDDNSDSSVKMQYKNKVAKALIGDPLDNILLRIAVEKTYGGPSKAGTKTIASAIHDIVANKAKEIPTFIECIIGGFLFEKNEQGQKNVASDIKTARFVDHVLKLFAKPNTKNKNILIVKEITEKFLEECSREFMVNPSAENRRKIRKAIIMYFALYIQKV